MIPRSSLVAACFAALVLFASTALAQERSLAGAWDGAIVLPTGELAIHVELTRAASGYTGDIDIPAQSAFDLPLSEIVLERDVARWTLSAVAATFEGALSSDGRRIEGTYTQGAGFPFRLERAGGEVPTGAAHDPLTALADFPEFASNVMESRRVPGAAIAVVQGDDILYCEGLGLRDVEAKRPTTPETLFAIGSSTKAFTATLVGILVDDGVLELDEPVVSYLPDFRLFDEYATKTVTPRDLLSHRTGLPRHDLVWYGSQATREELYHRLPYLEPTAAIRTTFQYQNLMFMTAGYLCGRVANSTWEDLVRERIFRPLEIGYANFSIAAMAKVDDAARGYADDGKGGLARMEYRNIDACGPAGSINANVLEMANWVMLQLGDGEFRGKRIVSRATMRELHSPQMIMPGWKDKVSPYSSYALGWMVEPYRGHDLLHHGGNIDGFSALITFLPDDDIGVIVLTNKNGSSVPTVLTYEAIDRVLGLAPLNHDMRAGPVDVDTAAAMAAAMAAAGGEKTGRVEGTRPSHPLDDYVGRYEHRGYGLLEIGRDDESLTIHYGAIDGALTHRHFDTFRFPGGPFNGLDFTFDTDPAGEVSSVSARLEPTGDSIRFVPRGPERLSDPAFLRSLVGEYVLPSGACTVALAGTQLSVNVAGQPTYSLDPHRGLRFRLRNLSGYTVEFVLEGETPVAVVFHQPNGVFRAERKAGR